MTKREIIHSCPIGLNPHGDLLSVPIEACQWAMEEWARIRSIQFANFISENYNIQSGPFYYKNSYEENGKTIDQLYELFEK